MSILDVIASKKDSVFSKSFFVRENISEKKLNNAISSYAQDVLPERVILIVDTTLFGSAKEGWLFSLDACYIKMDEIKAKISYEEIQDVKYAKEEYVDKKGKVKTKEFVSILLKNGEEITIPPFIECKSLEELRSLLLELKEAYIKADTTKISEKLPLEDMPSEVKKAYVKIILNFALEDDNKIDKTEMREILSLIYRLKFNSQDRFELYSYMSQEGGTQEEFLKDTQKQIEIIEAKLSDISLEEVIYSLLKDLIFIKSVVQKSERDSQIFSFLVEKFNISDEKINFFEKTVKEEQKIYSDEVDDNQLKEIMSNIISNAGAVGVPLAAIFLTGSVTGLSAASITSGLAFLGFGGILGFSSMVTGIGTAITLAILTQKGLKKLTGSSEIEKARRKEFLLQEIIKQTQYSINCLMSDINYLAKNLLNALEVAKEQKKKIEKIYDKMIEREQKIKKLTNALEFLTKGGKGLSEKVNMGEKARLRIRIPKELDIEKFKNLTDEPTKRKYQEYVFQFYGKEIKQEGDKTVEKFILKRDIPREHLENLVKIFEEIGYFKLEGVTKDVSQKVSKKFSKWLGGK